ncbi:MAG: Ig-like domain-containing protein [Flavobacteriaceae bacterium]|nr:Ig-like domain-containing protein [Flavobacteriaceae bacterium]MCY4253855.1 Ig-like domain-containing protein [Flavobacteriaceae bacterium]
MNNWKLNVVFATTFFIFLIFACQKADLPSIDPELRAVSAKELVLKIGQSPTLEVQYYDQTGKINPQSVVAWTSSNSFVVSVDAQTGTLTPLKPGTATITASVVAHSGAILRQEFSVSVPIEGSLTISRTSDSPVLIGSLIPIILSFQLVDQVNTRLTPSHIIWRVASTENPILSIDENGVIRPLKPGTATVLLTVTHENIDYKSSIEIEVIQEPTLAIINPNAEVKIENKGLEPLTVQYVNEKGQSIDAKTGTIRWESSDQEILGIDSQTGQLTPIKLGTVVVKVSFDIDGEQYAEEIEIEVIQEPILTIINSNTEVKIGNKDLTPLSIDFINQKGQNINPNHGKIRWESSRREILEITSDNGALNPIKPGIATIRIFFDMDGKQYSKEIEMEVTQDPTLEITNPNTEIKVEDKDLKPLTVQYVNEEGQIIDVNTGTIKWNSNSREILEIEPLTGKLMPKKIGMTIVSATFNLNGEQYTNEIEIEVTQQIELILPSIESDMRIDGKPIQIGDFVFTSEKGIEETPDSFCWKSSHTEVLTTDCQGNVTLNKPGKVYLTLTISDDGKDYRRKTQEIVVTQDPVIHFEFPKETSIEVVRTTQEPIQLGYRFMDENGNTVTPETIHWKSSNPEALKIDTNGMIMALKADQVKITVSAYQKEVLLARNELVIIVKQPAMLEIINPPNEVSTLQTDPIQLQIKYTDEDGKQLTPSTSSITWISDDEDKLKVDEDGRLTPVNEGEATITVQIGDKDLTASHTIVVKREVDPELELNQSSQTLIQGESLLIDFTYRDQTGQPSSPQPQGLWTVSDSSVIDFNEDTGEIRALSPGSSTISITVEGLTKAITISVEVEPELSIDFPDVPLQLSRDTHDLNPTFTDHFSRDRTASQIISYENYDENIITINDEGRINPVTTGQTSIIIKTVYRGQSYQRSSTIEVVSFTIQDVPHLEVGQADYTLRVNFIDEKGDTSNPIVSWSSDFFELSSGKIELNKPGRNKRINARYSYKRGTYTASTTTSVTTDVAFGIDSFDRNLVIPQNGDGSQTLSATLNDEYGQSVSDSNYQIAWTSDDLSVATINDSGVLTPISKGTANISAEAIYNNQSYQSGSFSIEVEQPILILHRSVNGGVLKGENVNFEYSFTDGNGGLDLTPSTIRWRGVNSNEVFSANDVGTYEVIIEVIYASYTYKDTAEIKVRELSITGKPSNDEVVLGDSNPDLDFNFKNEQDIVTNVSSSSWRLKDPNKSSVLTVDTSTGQITAKSEGSATVVLTITYENQDHFIEYQITVKNPPSVHIDLESSTYERSDFVWKGLNYWYLWQENVSDLDDSKASSDDDYKRFIEQNSDYSSFFKGLLYNRGQRGGDLYSYSTSVQEIASVHSAAGFDNGLLFQIARVKSGSSQLVGIVQFAFPGTPADGKVSRGDVFSHVNGTRLTTNNYQSLLSSNSMRLKMIELQPSVDLDNPIAEVDLNKTATISKQSNVTRDPIMAHSIISKGSSKIGYLAYYQFHRSVSDLNAVFKTFADEPITDLILDLRYNRGGYLSTATALGSMISGQSSSSVFLQKNYNSKVANGAENEYFIDYLDSARTVPVNKLNVSNVYVLTSDRTASASEAVISGISPYVNVTVIGEQTVGKHLATLYLFDHNDSPSNYYKTSGDINSDHTLVLSVVISSLTNSSGESYGYDGFTPSSSNQLIESLIDLKPLGDEQDPLVKRALNLITGTSSRRFFGSQNNQLIPMVDSAEGWLIETLD